MLMKQDFVTLVTRRFDSTPYGLCVEDEQELKDAFNIIDANKSGAITAQQLMTATQQIGKQYHIQQVRIHICMYMHGYPYDGRVMQWDILWNVLHGDCMIQ